MAGTARPTPMGRRNQVGQAGPVVLVHRLSDMLCIRSLAISVGVVFPAGATGRSPLHRHHNNVSGIAPVLSLLPACALTQSSVRVSLPHPARSEQCLPLLATEDKARARERRPQPMPWPVSATFLLCLWLLITAKERPAVRPADQRTGARTATFSRVGRRDCPRSSKYWPVATTGKTEIARDGRLPVNSHVL